MGEKNETWPAVEPKQEQQCKQARPYDELICELLDSRRPKNEREHAAAREIERLRAEIDALRALLEDTVRDSTNKIEALLAEVDQYKRRADAYFQTAERQGKRAERMAEALREAKETMLSQVKWEACDCGCPQGRKPADAVSVTWLRAVQQVEIATARAEDGK